MRIELKTIRRGLRLLFVCAGTALALLVAACGGSGAKGPQPMPGNAAPAVPLRGSPPGSALDLPSVASLREVSATAAAGRLATGNESIPALTSANTFLDSNDIVLLPNWDGAANFSPAYTGFELDLAGYIGPAELTAGMGFMGGTPPSIYLALANWERNTWQWFEATANETLALDSMEPYLRPADDHVFVLALMLGTDGAAVRWVRIGADYPGTAQLDADVTTGAAPLTVNFDTSNSVDLDDDFLLSIAPEDGDYFVVPFDGAYTHAYATPGNYTARLRVETEDGEVYFDTVEITVNGFGPLARLSADKYIGQPGVMVNFDGTASTDPDGAVVSYSWDFDGDGNADTGGPGVTMASHQYASVGTYHPTLAVTDNSGNTRSEYVTVVVGNPIHETEPNDEKFQADELPTVPFTNFLGDVGPTAPSGTGNTDVFRLRVLQPGHYTFNLQFIPGTGNLDIALRTASSELIYYAGSTGADEVFSRSLAPGEYLVYVYNRKLAENAEYALSMSAVYSELPLAQLAATPVSGNYPLAVQLSAAGSTDPDGSIAEYAWDPYGDGHFESTTGMTNNLAVTYNRRGTFAARLRVTDNAGAQSYATCEVLVSGPPLDEVEPNNTVATAQVLSLPTANFFGDCGYGGSPTSDNFDWYRVTVPSNGTLNAALFYNSVTALSQLDIYRVNMDNTATFINTWTSATDTVLMSYMVTQPGDYIIGVPVLHGSSEYRLDVELN